MVEHAAAVIGDDDTVAPGFEGFERAFGGHDALDDERRFPRGFDEDAQIGDALGIDGFAAQLHVDQSGRVHVHGHGHRAGGDGVGHARERLLHSPGFDGGHAPAVQRLDRLQRAVKGFVGRIAGEGGAAGGVSSFDDALAVGALAEVGSVIELHAADRRGEHGHGERASKELAARVLAAIGVERVEHELHFRERGDVAHERGAGPLAAHAGHLAAAGAPVAHRADAALGRQNFARRFQHFFVIHDKSPRNSKISNKTPFPRRHYTSRGKPQKGEISTAQRRSRHCRRSRLRHRRSKTDWKCRAFFSASCRVVSLSTKTSLREMPALIPGPWGKVRAAASRSAPPRSPVLPSGYRRHSGFCASGRKCPRA